MGLNVTNVFIAEACDALRDRRKCTESQNEKLCDELIELCKKYAPGTFEDSKLKLKKSKQK